MSSETVDESPCDGYHFHGYFFSENAAGNPTLIRIRDFSSIVHDKNRELLRVRMNSGEEFGFSPNTIEMMYHRLISMKTEGVDPSVMLFKLFEYYGK